MYSGIEASCACHCEPSRSEAWQSRLMETEIASPDAVGIAMTLWWLVGLERSGQARSMGVRRCQMAALLT